MVTRAHCLGSSAALECDRYRDLARSEGHATVTDRRGGTSGNGADDNQGCHAGENCRDDSAMPTNKAGEVTASECCEHPVRLGARSDSRKRLSTVQPVVLDGVEVLGAGVLGAGVLLEADDVPLPADELELPVFVFLSRESLR